MNKRRTTSNGRRVDGLFAEPPASARCSCQRAFILAAVLLCAGQVGTFSVVFVHTWMGQVPQKVVRGRWACQVGTFSAIYVHTWMGQVPQKVVRGRWACQVGTFSVVFVHTWMGQVPQRVSRCLWPI